MDGRAARGRVALLSTGRAIGDGRQEVRKIPDASYDLLILDAFSGDAIPTHLITVEALRDDLRVLKPGGMLVVHVSNRYYELSGWA